MMHVLVYICYKQMHSSRFSAVFTLNSVFKGSAGLKTPDNRSNYEDGASLRFHMTDDGCFQTASCPQDCVIILARSGTVQS